MAFIRRSPTSSAAPPSHPSRLSRPRAYALHRAAPLTALTGPGIAFTHLLAMLVLGDKPGEWQVTGSLLVIAAGLLLAWGREPAPAEPRVLR